MNFRYDSDLYYNTNLSVFCRVGNAKSRNVYISICTYESAETPLENGAALSANGEVAYPVVKK